MPINVAITAVLPVAATETIAHNNDRAFTRLLSTIKQYVLIGKAQKPMMLIG